MTLIFKSMHHVIMRFIVIAVAVFLLVACSGGETGTGLKPGTGPEKTVTVGRITGFGSVFVNDVEFETAESTFSLDNVAGAEADLKLGMVVAVEGTINEDELSGDAAHIEYQDIIEATVFENLLDANGSGVLNIAGQTVNINEATVFDSRVAAITGKNQIAVNNVVEVSGFSSGDGIINASRIEVMAENFVAGEEIEIKGRVSALDTSAFMIGSLIVDYSAADLLDFPAGGIADGQLVEVVTNSGFKATGEMEATIVTFLLQAPPGLGGVKPPVDTGNGSPNSASSVSIEGTVNVVITPGEEFELNGQRVLIMQTTVLAAGASVDDIVENVSVRVNGKIDVDGVITAKLIRIL